jgi:GT2 family glycosyltransferase
MNVPGIVPTYFCPDYLEWCVASLLAQSRMQDEIIIVPLDTDDDEPCGQMT